MANTSPPKTRKLRIGILGCANIAKKNALAILQGNSCTVTAVASRSMEKAQTFRAFVQDQPKNAIHLNIQAFGGESAYIDLLKCQEVDAVYIPLPTTLHKEYVLQALEAGKHVLVEKPVALSAKDYQEMLEVARHRGRLLLDGTMFVHHPRTSHFVQACHDAEQVGKIRRIEGGFSFCGDDNFFGNNIRIKASGDPLGCIGDLGWYVVRMALLVVLGPEDGHKELENESTGIWKSAQVVDCTCNEEGVPIDATCLVKFANGTVLQFHCGFLSQFRQYVKVIGTKAWAEMNDWVLPKQHPIFYSVQRMQLTDYDLITNHDIVAKQEFEGPVQEVLMWETFATLSNHIQAKGWDGCSKATHLAAISSLNQEILDALMTSIRQDGATVKASA